MTVADPGGGYGVYHPPKIRKKSLTVKLCLLSEIISKTCLFLIKVHFCRSRLSALTLYSFVFRHLTQPQMVFLGRCVSPPPPFNLPSSPVPISPDVYTPLCHHHDICPSIHHQPTKCKSFGEHLLSLFCQTNGRPNYSTVLFPSYRLANAIARL